MLFKESSSEETFLILEDVLRAVAVALASVCSELIKELAIKLGYIELVNDAQVPQSHYDPISLLSVELHETLLNPTKRELLAHVFFRDGYLHLVS